MIAHAPTLSAYAPTLRCPTCRAEQPWTDVCRRCKSDLAIVRRAAEACRQSRRRALAAARAGRWTKALAEARRAHAICPGPESRRLLAVCHLLAGNLGQAMVLAAQDPEAGS